MLTSLIVAALLVFSILIVVFLYIDSNNKEKKKQEHLKQIEQANNIRSRFKVNIAQIAEELALPADIRTKLLMIGNNYFVFQPITESTLINQAENLDKVSDLLSILQVDFAARGDESAAKDKIDSFVDALPSSSRGFNSAFYNGNLNIVCQLLTMTAQSTEHDDEEGDEQDDEASIGKNDETPVVDPVEQPNKMSGLDNKEC